MRPARSRDISPYAATAFVALAFTVLSVLAGAGVAWGSGGFPPPPPPPPGSGPPPTLTVSNKSPHAGDTITVGLGIGPCTPGTPVSLWIVLTQDGSVPIQVGPTNPPILADPEGGFLPVSVTIPGPTPPGVYVLFALCGGINGPVVVTVGITVLPSGAGSSQVSGAIVPPDANWQAPSTWGDPITRSVVSASVDQAAAQFQPGADTGPAPPTVGSGSRLSDALANTHGGTSLNAAEIAGLTVLLLAILVAMVWIRRHRPASRA